MTLVILTARPATAANRRLREATADLGVHAEIVDCATISAETGGGSSLLLGGRELLNPRPSAVIARIGNWRPETLLAMLEAAVAAGVPTPNPPSAIRLGRDHWLTVLRLDEVGIPAPRTVAVMDPERGAEVAARLGLPAVVKLRRSRMGVGVMLCRELDHLESVLDSLWRLGDEFVVQEFVAPGGSSRRALVVGDRIVAAAEFAADGGEWRSNGARGGMARGIDLDSESSALAVAAAQAVGLGICGVDLLPGPHGPVVCEVNPTPGFSALEEATGADVAGAMVRHALGL